MIGDWKIENGELVGHGEAETSRHGWRSEMVIAENFKLSAMMLKLGGS